MTGDRRAIFFFFFFYLLFKKICNTQMMLKINREWELLESATRLLLYFPYTYYFNHFFFYIIVILHVNKSHIVQLLYSRLSMMCVCMLCVESFNSSMSRNYPRNEIQKQLFM